MKKEEDHIKETIKKLDKDPLYRRQFIKKLGAGLGLSYATLSSGSLQDLLRLSLGDANAQISGFATWKKKYPLDKVLEELGLSTSIACVLDFGDRRCYPGSGSTVTSLVDASETWTISGSLPFNGVAGRLSDQEYFRGNSSGYITQNSGFTWDDNWNRSTGQFSYFGIVQWGGASDYNNFHKLFSNSAWNGGRGVGICICGDALTGSSDNDVLTVWEAQSSYRGHHLSESIVTVPKNQWCAVGVSFDASANTIRFMVNRFTQTLSTSLWQSNESSNSSGRPRLFAWSSGDSIAGNSNHRIACCAYWNNRVLTEAEFFSIYDRMKLSRFTVLP